MMKFTRIAKIKIVDNKEYFFGLNFKNPLTYFVLLTWLILLFPAIILSLVTEFFEILERYITSVKQAFKTFNPNNYKDDK